MDLKSTKYDQNLILKRGNMMSDVKVSVLMVFLIIMLTGCVSIPIGNNVLEISTDGISFNSSDGNSEEFTDREDNAEITGFSLGGQLPEDFPEDIYFPEDAQIINVFEIEDDSQKAMSVMYEVGGDRQTELLDIYREYVLDNDLEIFIDGLDPDGVGQQISAMIIDGPSFMANVKIEEGNSFVEVKYIKRW